LDNINSKQPIVNPRNEKSPVFGGNFYWYRGRIWFELLEIAMLAAFRSVPPAVAGGFMSRVTTTGKDLNADCADCADGSGSEIFRIFIRTDPLNPPDPPDPRSKYLFFNHPLPQVVLTGKTGRKTSAFITFGQTNNSPSHRIIRVNKLFVLNFGAAVYIV